MMSGRNFYLKYHLFLFPLMLVVGFGLFYNFSIKDKLNKIRKITQDIEKKQSIINLYKDKIELEGELAQVVKRFPRSIDLKWLIQNINEIITRKNLEVISIQPLPIKKKNFCKVLKVSLLVQGSYNQIGEMIAEIDNSKSYLEIEEIALSPAYLKSKGGKIKAKTKEGNTILNCRFIVATVIPELL